MKIPLNMNNNGVQSTKAAQAKILGRDLELARKGDWNARNDLIRIFLPLITTLAQKRGKDAAKVNQFIDAGKEGVFKAARKFKPGDGADQFNLFVVEYIEKAMDRTEKGSGFFARLFGG